MSVSLVELDQVDPDAIDAVFKAATDRARDIRAAAIAIGDIVTATPWEGQARDAALEATGRAQFDLTTHATECDAIAKAAKTAEVEFREIKSEWTRVQRMADKWGISINVETGELSYMPVEPRLQRTMEERVDIVEAEIQNLLLRADAADQALAGAIRVATGLETAESLDNRLGQRPEVPMDEEAGNGDGQDLLDGQLSPDASERLLAATTLTDEQRNALLRGHTTQIPAEQLAYLSALSNSLDGQSTDKLAGLMTQLNPEQAQALSGAVALASNPNVIAGPPAPGKPGAPARGDAANIPSAFQGVLDRPALTEFWSQPPTPGVPQPPGGPHLPQPIAAPTVAPGLDDLATFVGAGDPSLQTGSAISSGLMDKTRELLDQSEKVAMPAYPDGTVQDRPQWYHERIDPTLQQMVSVAGRDSISLHDAVTSPGGQDFLGDLNRHQWADDGQAVTDMFRTVSANALVDNPNDPTDVALAHRSGETAHAFADYWANHWNDLKDIDGNTAVGQVNPRLAQGMATMLDPYIGDMVGRPTNPTHGFGPLDTVDDLIESNPHHTKQLFALMNTDDHAAEIFNGAAMRQMLQLGDRAADSLAADPGGAFYNDMQAMGQLQGIIDAANEAEHSERAKDGNAYAQSAYDRRSSWMDWVQRGASYLPFVGPYVGDARAVLDELFKPPTPNPETQAPALVDMTKTQYYLIDNFARQNLGNIEKIGDLWDGERFLPYGEALDKQGLDLTNIVGQYIDSVNKTGRDVNALLNYWYIAYNNARGYDDVDTN